MRIQICSTNKIGPKGTSMYYLITKGSCLPNHIEKNIAAKKFYVVLK